MKEVTKISEKKHDSKLEYFVFIDLIFFFVSPQDCRLPEVVLLLFSFFFVFWTQNQNTFLSKQKKNLYCIMDCGQYKDLHARFNL